MSNSKECSIEKYWQNCENGYLTSDRYIVVDGVCYYDGGFKKNVGPFDDLGHGGAVFRIKMNDGTERITNNLWHQGDIPENHRAVMKDNATFVE